MSNAVAQKVKEEGYDRFATEEILRPAREYVRMVAGHRTKSSATARDLANRTDLKKQQAAIALSIIEENDDQLTVWSRGQNGTRYIVNNE